MHAFVRDGVGALSVESIAPIMRTRHSRISAANVERLCQQGLYYATKADDPARAR